MLRAIATYYETLCNVTVSEVLLRYLKLEGIDTVFGVPGQGVSWIIYTLAMSEKNDLLEPEDGIRYIISRHDGSATFMADGYARVSGKLGVCLVTSGPGATNAVTGAAVAQADSSAVLTIGGEVSEEEFGRGGFQEGADSGQDVVTMYRSVTDYSELVSNASNFQTIFQQALRTSLSLPKRATYVAIPMSIGGQVLDSIQMPLDWRNYRTTAAGCYPEQSRQAFESLFAGQRPLLFLGSGCREALINPLNPAESSQRLGDFIQFVVEKHGIPVMTTPRAKGIFPESHPLSLRNYGMASCTWGPYYLLQHKVFDQPEYDALMVIGTGLKQWSTNAWNPMLVPSGPLVQVDLDAGVIARGFPVSLGIVADAAAVIDYLIEYGKATDPAPGTGDRTQFITQVLKQKSPYPDPEKRQSEQVPVLPQRLMAELQAVLDDKDVIGEQGFNLFVDVGNVLGWTWSQLVIDPPSQIWYNTGHGSMGWGNAAVIGGKIAQPGKPAIAITGDGGFFMNGKEISTAVQHQIGCVWIIFNDNNLRMVSQGMGIAHPTPPPGTTWFDFYELGNPDLVQFATSLGAVARRVTQPGELQAWLLEMIRAAERDRRPQVLVCDIDIHEAPPYPYPPEIMALLHQEKPA